MVKRKFLIAFLFICFITLSPYCFSQKEALAQLEDLLETGTGKEILLNEQVNDIWYNFYTQEKLRWQDSEYQKSMIVVTLSIEDKYGKCWLNPFLIHSFSALKYLIDQLAENLGKEEEAIRYCYVIAAYRVCDSADDPIMFYFSKKATEIWRQMISEGKTPSGDAIQNLLLTLEYAPYEGAEKDAWDIFVNISPDKGAYFYGYVDSLAVIHWRLGKNLSNKQVNYVLKILEKVDKERLHKPDFILLVAKDKSYARKIIMKKHFKLNYKEVRKIQDYMLEYMKINIFERGDF